jgi:hypothetical protein
MSIRDRNNIDATRQGFLAAAGLGAATFLGLGRAARGEQAEAASQASAAEPFYGRTRVASSRQRSCTPTSLLST